MMTSTNSTADSISDQERLSAWLDGELTGDAARFFSKRVAHDQDLLDTAQRWSLAAELLRESAGDSRSAVPHGFLDRVRVAIDQERALSADSDAVHAERFTGQQFTRTSSRAAAVVAAALPSRRWRVPASLAASVSVVAVAALLMRFGLGGTDSPVTTLALQQATLPQVKANNAETRRDNAQRNRRLAANSGRNTTRIAGLTVDRRLQIPAPRRDAMAAASSVAIATPVVADSVSTPRRTLSVPLSRALKANAVASSNDPFGLGNTTDDRILSGKPWPSASGAASGVMNASFSTAPSQSASPWGDPMSLGLSAGAN